MTDLFNTLASYLNDVFVIKFDGWVILGFIAQGFFTMRFVVQWIASERARKSVIPVAFWFFSIGGGVLLLIYALYRRDPVFIAGQALGLLVYIRNLYFIIVNGRQASARATIHPNLSKFVVLVRQHWPTAHIRIVTNGFFLYRHPELPSMLAADGNADLALSIHHDGADYAERLRPIFDLLAVWQRDHGATVHIWQSHQVGHVATSAPATQCFLSRMAGRDKAGKSVQLSALQTTV